MITLSYLILLVLVTAGAWGARMYEVRIKLDTAVSTVEETDYVLPPALSKIGIATAAFFIAVLAVQFLTGVSLLVGVAVTVAYGLLRYGLLVQYRTAAVLSSDTRQSIALQRPEFAGARFAFFLSAPDLTTPDHLTMWHDEFDALDQPWIILFKEQKHLASFRTSAKTPGVFILQTKMFRSSLPESAELVFYANNGQQNRRMIAENPGRKHIQLLHGDSDKPPSYSPLTKNYDYVFVAGQMAIDRYKRNGVTILKERFRIVGRPQVKAIEKRGSAPSEQTPCIVYMPTWRGFHEDTQFSSLDRANDILDMILSGQTPVRVLFKPHPMSYKDPDWKRFEKKISATLSKKRKNGNRGTFSTDDTLPFDLYNQADVIVTDISSVLIDSLYSEKPIIVIEPANFDHTQAENFPSLKASYVVRSDLSNLTVMFDDATGPDTLLSARKDVKKYAFGDSGRAPGEAFQEACFELMENGLDNVDKAASEGK